MLGEYRIISGYEIGILADHCSALSMPFIKLFGIFRTLSFEICIILPPNALAIKMRWWHQSHMGQI